MAGRDRLKEIVGQQVKEAITEAGKLVDAANDPAASSIMHVDAVADRAAEALGKARDAARILIREGERGE